MLRKSILVMLLVLSATAAQAKPAEIAPVIKATEPQGKGALSWMWLTAYHAELWTDQPVGEGALPAPPYALSIVYDMDFTADELLDRSIEEMDKAQSLSDAEKKTYSAQLAAVIPAVKKGDRITALRDAAKQVVMYHNGTQTGVLADAVLADRFLGIWLAPTTSEPKLRMALLGLEP